MRRKSQKASVRQQEILQYIKAFLLEKGYPPSVREIGKAVGLKSSSTVHGYLAKLEERGCIRRDPTKPRAIDILEEKPWGRNIPVPLVTDVSTVPIFADKHLENKMYSLPAELLGAEKAVFMLRMKDMSLRGQDILKDDYLLVHEQQDFADGDLLVVLAQDPTATGEPEALVRHVYRDHEQYRLQAANDDVETIFVDKVVVVGKVVGIYRQLR